MKKNLFAFFFIIIISLVAACGGERQAMAVPEFPLGKISITAALQELELPWSIEEAWRAEDAGGPVAFSLYKDGAIIAGLTSGTASGERIIHIAFVSSHNHVYSLPEDKWESLMVLSTILFGGFESTHQVYQYFRSEFDSENTVRLPIESPGLHDQVASWERVVNGIYCRVVVERATSSQQEYLALIQFASDLDTFALTVQATTPTD